MAKKNASNAGTIEDKIPSGLPHSDKPRSHCDIYAILEAPQELYFGDEKEVNVNIVEKVRVWTPEGEREKCYISPTKRRGVERRCLLWSDAGGSLLMDKLRCGIPDTCCKVTCPVCRVFGGLITGGDSSEDADASGGDSPESPDTGGEETVGSADSDAPVDKAIQKKAKGKKERRTFIGRLTHAGGVAVSGQIALEKQRAMHPALVYKEKGDKEPMPYRKEYAQPGLLYPISNHCLSIDEDEFGTVAYAFLMSLNRLGAGNPKGVSLARAVWNECEEPLLVVDKYRVPMGERPVISPSITDNDRAKAAFIQLAGSLHPNVQGQSEDQQATFRRFHGKEALRELQSAAQRFEKSQLRASKS